MIDLFGTPYTEKLHVVERYRLADLDGVKDTLQRGAKENWRPAGPVRSTTPTSTCKSISPSRIGAPTRRHGLPAWSICATGLEWPEIACAENTFGFHHDKDADVPRADRPDF